MRVEDRNTGEISVGRDTSRAVVEVRIDGASGDDARVIRLNSEEARRLAALVLFQAAKLDHPHARWTLPYASPVRKSA